ncbi:hypothetical protein GCM10023156_13300 [Novipirellula rosea]|uniref:Uncharacterized protein n=1 Tax=Novipirellula rosea TaxID=1031540 RepID=A0ABP8MHA2_9BACT
MFLLQATSLTIIIDKRSRPQELDVWQHWMPNVTSLNSKVKRDRIAAFGRIFGCCCGVKATWCPNIATLTQQFDAASLALRLPFPTDLIFSFIPHPPLP